ncbi:hypothetical protein ES703_88908 [subsurface metagenome]
MKNTISVAMMFTGVGLFGFAFIFKATDQWQWGQRNLWKIGVVGIIVLLIGMLIKAFV